MLDLPTHAINIATRPGMQIAVEWASETEQGLEALAELDKVVSMLADDRNDWSLSATRLAIAIAVGSEEPQSTAASAKTLLDQLPPVAVNLVCIPTLKQKKTSQSHHMRRKRSRSDRLFLYSALFANPVKAILKLSISLGSR